MTELADWSTAKAQEAVTTFVDSLEDRLVEANLDPSLLEDTGPIEWTVAGGRDWDAKREITITGLDPQTGRSILQAALDAGMRTSWKARDSVHLDGPYETVELWCPMTVHQLCFQVASILLDPSAPDAREGRQLFVQWVTTGEFADHAVTVSDDEAPQEYLTTMLTDYLADDFNVDPDHQVLFGHFGANLAGAIDHVVSLDMVTAARLITGSTPTVRVARTTGGRGPLSR